MADVPSTTLNHGVQIPQLGFGVFQVPPEQTAEVVAHALGAGYRHIDTAALYRNEQGVGEAVARSGLPRDEVFVTTKLGNPDQGYDETMRAFDRSVDRLGLDTVDLYLIHWPLPARDRYVDTWRAFEKLHADGRIRAIGVSNFQIPHLERLFDETDVVPAVNQIELHPYLVQTPLRQFHARHGIATEAWSPIAQGAVLDDPVITGLAQKYAKSPAQLVIRWHLELGNIVIPKSVTPARIEQNIDVFDFELAEDDVEAITALNRNERTGPDPDHFNGG
jgi:2,5-diketo-D-gluconate reductase A